MTIYQLNNTIFSSKRKAMAELKEVTERYIKYHCHPYSDSEAYNRFKYDFPVIIIMEQENGIFDPRALYRYNPISKECEYIPQ